MKKLMSFIFLVTICFNTAIFTYSSEPQENLATALYSSDVALRTLEALKSVNGAKSDELVLSRPTDNDLIKLAEVYKSSKIGYFLRNNDRDLTLDEAINDLKKYNSENNISFAIKDNVGNLIGELMLTLLNDRVVNMAYWILPQFRGHNYAAKACALLVKESLAKESSLVFLIGFDENNQVSKKVAEKLEALLNSKNGVSDTVNGLKKLNYKFLKDGPFKIKYQITSQSKDNSEFELNIFINDVKVSSRICTAEQIENITYKKIFNQKEVEITRWNYWIKLVY